jgi:hypothetical protein
MEKRQAHEDRQIKTNAGRYSSEKVKNFVDWL